MRHTIKLDDEHVIVLDTSDFDDNVNLDKILMIDYNNIEAEMVTFPLILTRLGILLADAENKLRERELALERWENSYKEKVRADLLTEKKENKYTNDDINYYMRTRVYGSKLFEVYKKAVNKAQHNRDIVNTFYWSAKDKSDKLNALFQKLHPEQLSLDKIGNAFNGIKIRVREAIIK